VPVLNDLYHRFGESVAFFIVIAYKSKPGPFGFKPADLEAALQPLVSDAHS